MSDTTANLKRDALDILARREHSRFELKNKLCHKGYDETEVENFIDNLIKQNLQSDERFIDCFTRYRATKGFGPVKILLELRTKGIDESIAKDIVYSEDYDWYELALTVLEKKFSNSDIDKFKQKRFLLNRGFTHDIIHEVVDNHY